MFFLKLRKKKKYKFTNTKSMALNHERDSETVLVYSLLMYLRTLTVQTWKIQIVAALTERTLTEEQMNMFLGSQRLWLLRYLLVSTEKSMASSSFVMTGSNCLWALFIFKHLFIYMLGLFQALFIFKLSARFRNDWYNLDGGRYWKFDWKGSCQIISQPTD